MMPTGENVTPKNDAAGDVGEAAPNFRGLKALVIVLGIAIAGMLALITYTISQRAAAKLAGDPEEVVEQPLETVSATLEGTFNIGRPAGAELLSVQANGAELVFHFRGPDGDVVITLDRRTGKQTRVDIAGK